MTLESLVVLFCGVMLFGSAAIVFAAIVISRRNPYEPEVDSESRLGEIRTDRRGRYTRLSRRARSDVRDRAG